MWDVIRTISERVDVLDDSVLLGDGAVHELAILGLEETLASSEGDIEVLLQNLLTNEGKSISVRGVRQEACGDGRSDGGRRDDADFTTRLLQRLHERSASLSVLVDTKHVRHGLLAA
jgi:hypothetical protein